MKFKKLLGRVLALSLILTSLSAVPVSAKITEDANGAPIISAGFDTYDTWDGFGKFKIDVSTKELVLEKVPLDQFTVPKTEYLYNYVHRDGNVGTFLPPDYQYMNACNLVINEYNSGLWYSHEEQHNSYTMHYAELHVPVSTGTVTSYTKYLSTPTGYHTQVELPTGGRYTPDLDSLEFYLRWTSNNLKQEMIEQLTKLPFYPVYTTKAYSSFSTGLQEYYSTCLNYVNDVPVLLNNSMLEHVNTPVPNTNHTALPILAISDNSVGSLAIDYETKNIFYISSAKSSITVKDIDYAVLDDPSDLSTRSDGSSNITFYHNNHQNQSWNNYTSTDCLLLMLGNTIIGIGEIISLDSPARFYRVYLPKEYIYKTSEVLYQTPYDLNLGNLKSVTIKNCSNTTDATKISKLPAALLPLNVSGSEVIIDGGTYTGQPAVNGTNVLVKKGTFTDLGNSASTFIIDGDSEQTVVKDGTTTITTVKLSNPPVIIDFKNSVKEPIYFVRPPPIKPQ